MGRAACLCRRTDIEAHPTLERCSKRRNTSMFMHVPKSLYIRAPFSNSVGQFRDALQFRTASGKKAAAQPFRT
jgi:hypothetical protein